MWMLYFPQSILQMRRKGISAGYPYLMCRIKNPIQHSAKFLLSLNFRQFLSLRMVIICIKTGIMILKAELGATVQKSVCEELSVRVQLDEVWEIIPKHRQC